MTTEKTSEPGLLGTLSSTSSKGRFGVAYVRAVCSQAGFGFTETSPDEDVLAVDGLIDFAPCPARVQVKCTGRFRLPDGSTASWQAEESWRGHWKQSKIPVYFILVIVDPDDQLAWLHHQNDGTLHRAAAYWVRVDQLPDQSRITVLRAVMDWAPVITPPMSLSSIAIPAESAELVQNVADRLRQTRVDPSQVFTGTIVQLRHADAEDPYGEIAASTIRKGHQSEVLVRLPLDDYERAWEWHYQGRAVLVEGVVRRFPGQRLRVDRATRFHPVDEMFLPENE